MPAPRSFCAGSAFPEDEAFSKAGAAGIWDASARIQPRVSFEYELWGGAAIWSGNAINWRHKFRSPKLSRSLALEVSLETPTC